MMDRLGLCPARKTKLPGRHHIEITTWYYIETWTHIVLSTYVHQFH